MAEKKSFPWLLLAGFGALVYFFIRDQSSGETPKAYPYPVGSTASSLTPSAGVVLTPSTPAPTPAPDTTRRHPPLPRPTPTPPPPIHVGPLPPTPVITPPIPRGHPVPMLPPRTTRTHPRRITDIFHRAPTPKPTITPTLDRQTIIDKRVIGNPAGAPLPMYNTTGSLIGYRR